MKTSREEPNRQPGRGEVVARFFLISAALGLAIGLFEASLLWTTPRIIPLLVPDVGWVIWFLAPLVDMVFFGLVGVGLGWLSNRITAKELPIAIEGGIAVTFVYLMLRWLHSVVGLHPFKFGMEVLFPLIILAAGSAVSLLFLAVIWHRLGGFLEPIVLAPLKPLVWGLAAVTVVAIVGIGVFVVRPSFSTTSAQAAPPPSGAPNVIFITLDTVRADHLSAYGYNRPTTPNLDRFARTGVLFENAIAPTSWTLSSHASMFTGLLPQQHGADFVVPLSSNPWTLAEILRSQGYETAGIIANTGYLEKGWGVSQGFESYADYRSSIKHNLSQTLVGIALIQPLYQNLWSYDWFERRNAAELNQEVFQWLRHRPKRPYFLFVNYFDTHDPYLTVAPYNHRFGRLSMALAANLNAAGDFGFRHRFTRRDRALLADGYDNCLAYLDDQVGKLLEFLSRSSAWRNTIVIITSDHGEEFGGHGDYIHGFDLYRELLHVPLIIAGPGIPKGVRISHIVSTRELFSTVLDLAGGGRTPFSRYSLARFWNPAYKPASFDDAVVSELIPAGDLSGQHAMMSLTTPQWQYIEHRSGRQELYRWTVDPEEKDNLAASPQDQATLNSLRSRLINLVRNATGPWHGTPYLHALDKVAGSSQFSLLFPKPLQPGAAGNPFRIGIAQAYFKPQESKPTRPSQSERELLKSLPYQ
ncbi:MAG: sulfatase-like hydrolase/transferase [Acidobacteriota bacterium]